MSDNIIQLKADTVGYRASGDVPFPPLYRLWKSSSIWSMSADGTPLEPSGPDPRYFTGPIYTLEEPEKDRFEIHRCERIGHLTPPAYGGPDNVWVYITACSNEEQVSDILHGWDQAVDGVWDEPVQPKVYRTGFGLFVVNTKVQPQSHEQGLLHYCYRQKHPIFGWFWVTEIIDPLGRVHNEDATLRPNRSDGHTATHIVPGMPEPLTFADFNAIERELIDGDAFGAAVNKKILERSRLSSDAPPGCVLEFPAGGAPRSEAEGKLTSLSAQTDGEDA